MSNSNSLDIPLTISFKYYEITSRLTRENNFCDISDLRNDSGSVNFATFKSSQEVYLDDIKEEIKEDPIKIVGKKTYVHEKILERVLRFFAVSEADVIDKFVHPSNRSVGYYEYDKLKVLIHLESKYINASKFCPLFRKKMWRWTELKATKDLIKFYAEQHNLEIDEVVKKGLEYDFDDSWIPQNLLPMLAMWCSPEYALFVSDIMNLYHTDPMKLVALAIKEHDRQTGQHTVAIIASTDNKEEYEQRVQFLEDQLKAYAEKLVSKDNQLVLATNKYELVKLEKNMVEFDLIGLKDDTKMYRNVLNDWGGDNIALDGQLRLTSEVLSNQEEKYSYQIEELNTWVQKLKDELTLERSEKSQLIDELNIAQAENETLMEEKDNLDEYEEEMAIEQSKKKRAPRGTSTASTASTAPKSKTAKPKAPKKQKGKESSGAMYEPLILKDPKDKSISISIYTKIDLDGISCIYAPGKLVKSYQSKMNYQHRGSAQLANVKGTSASEYLDNFIEENPTAFISHSGYEFMVEKNETFERKFNEFFKDVILKKILSSGYPARASECLTSF
jgi:hypothetical protein